MPFKKLFPALVLTSLLCGCNTLTMNYTCNPAGATLYQNDGQNLGLCPNAVNYGLTAEDKQRGYLNIPGTTAKWVSGASSYTTPTITVNLANGHNQSLNFERPRDVAGYDIDANYALKLQRNAIMAQQAQEQADTNALMLQQQQIEIQQLQQQKK